MRARTALAFGSVALVAVAIGAYVFLAQTSAPPTAATRGPFAGAAQPKSVAELRFEDDAGRARSLADFRGKLVLLNLWATWCAPCREEMPALDRLQAQLGGPRFEVVALSVDQQGLAVSRNFFAEAGIKSLALYVDPSAQATFKLGVVGLPSSLLVDAQGREIARHIGPAKWDSPEVVDMLRQRIAGTER